MQLRVDTNGGVHCVYTEVIDLTALGTLAIHRASHVEPDGKGRWWADLSPVGGPVLGPFATRTPALHAEHTWLEAHWLLFPSAPPPL